MGLALESPLLFVAVRLVAATALLGECLTRSAAVGFVIASVGVFPVARVARERRRQ